MDKQQAQRMIKDTFEDSFDKARFTGFIKNLLNNIEDTPFTYQGNYIPDAYKQYIKTLERIGKFNDGENNIDLLVITLQKETSLERARTMQRNFIAWYLNGSRGGEMKDAALLAYVSPDATDWRFSLVKMDYKFEKNQSGKMKVKEEFTPARRWSFLVGTNEKSHTAQSRLVSILSNDEQAPNLAEIENAFDIEKVTKEFFLKYRELFMRTKDELDSLVQQSSSLKNEFEAKGVDTVNFAKKLLGQIVFLYFLQKKGWFGVGRDDDWNSGSKQFLRELFEKKHGGYKNFFNDVLEHLFYDALRNDRRHDDSYYGRFDCKIPFLNGGLFDPIGNYDWVHIDIDLPQTLFSNDRKTKEGDSGDGILDIFDRYNFTVKEDEPLEKEVAIDPELLGKAYEKFNAIRPDNYEEFRKALVSGKTGEENKFNKKFGVYYTPREIVHYMCQQSLSNYLYTELNQEPVSYERPGLSQLDMLGNTDTKGQLDLVVEHKAYPIISKEDLDYLIQSGEHVGENEARVLNKGRETSTYFHKLPESIRKNVERIDQKLADIMVCDPAVGSGAFPVGMMSEIVKTRNVLSNFIQNKTRTTYQFKRRCIEHSLYGVDIDPGAVEIAKLRLWLSLVVDEEEIKNIKPLPNLDYKVLCGNSLLGVERDLLNDYLFEEIEKLKPLFFNETNPTKKQEYQKQIDDLISQITEGHKEFDFEIYFSEVFHQKGGFDVVIGNPPYVQIQKYSKEQKDKWITQKYDTYTATGDIYCLFYERAYRLLKNSGHTCFITSNQWMRTAYGEKLRNFLSSQVCAQKLLNFGDGIFDATTNTNILLFEKNKNPVPLLATIVRDQNNFDFHKKLSWVSLAPTSEAWIICSPEEHNILFKMKTVGTPLKDKVWDVSIKYGIKTGFDAGFIVDGETRSYLIEKDANSDKILKPLLKGKDLKRYKSNFEDLWLIMSHNGYKETPPINIKEYPAIKNHLYQYWEKISVRQDKGVTPYNLRNCAYVQEFEKEKITWGNLGQSAQFTLAESGIIINAPSPLITPANRYLLAVLNSRLGDFFIRSFGVIRSGGYFEYKPMFVEQLPVPLLPETEQKPFADLADEILSQKRANPEAVTSVPETQIDRLVFELYGLTEEEIQIVENHG